MVLFLSLIIISFVITSIAIVPFIDALYKLKFLRKKQKTHDFLGNQTPIFDKFHHQKAGTPIGGGILLLSLMIIIFALTFLWLRFSNIYISSFFPIVEEINIIFFTLISFGFLGFFDDIKKMFNLEEKGVFGLRLRYKFIIQWILALTIGFFLYFNLGIDIINVPFLGIFKIGVFYIPLSALIIVAFTNAFNITDGLDGLASGLLIICLFAFSFISFQIFDTPNTVFIAIWIGTLIAFLYFNIYPARIFLGDTGALAFGATMAVIGLMLGKIIALTVVGGVFIIEIGSSLLQMLSKSIRKKKLFSAAPLHLWFQNKGWEQPKIVMRAWLTGLMLAILGLLLATM